MTRPAAHLTATAVLAFALCACSGNAQPLTTATSPDAVALSGSSFAAMYDALDDAAIDAYLVGALLDPAHAVGAAEVCVKPNNGIGSRQSVLANPPLAASSIAQRVGLVEALVAYELALAALVDDAPQAEASIAIGDLQRAAFRLSVAANAHAQGDLFIEDLASSFAAGTAKLAGTQGRSDVKRIVVGANPTIAKLLRVLSADVSVRHAEASNAARLDYERWLAYYDAVRRGSPAKGPTTPRAAPIPSCFEPVIPTSSVSRIADETARDGASFPGRDAILTRLQRARDRYAVLQSADPTDMIASLSALNGTLTTVLQSPGDANGANALHGALTRLRSSAQTFATAFQSLDRGTI